ncbi:hypothetical protein [Streptomyces lincolnensis]|uniref:hypothetical protein n=1 Tax=Streptomyces lincolnensis TaxID=1915 RepID=UPI0037CDE1EF
MAEPTQTAGTATSPTAYGWCAWHQGHSGGVRLMDAFECGSGPGTGRNLFACAPCRETHHLVPLADRP